jgi:hypothetical protein
VAPGVMGLRRDVRGFYKETDGIYKGRRMGDASLDELY